MVVDPSAGHFVPMERVERAWDGWLKNPIFHPRDPDDAARLMGLRDEYLDEARGRATERGVWDEMTAYLRGRSKAVMDHAMPRPGRASGRKFLVQPSAPNPRAIRAFEEAGFLRLDVPPGLAMDLWGPGDHLDGTSMARTEPLQASG